MSEGETQPSDQPPPADCQPMVPATAPANDRNSSAENEPDDEPRYSSRAQVLANLDRMPGMIAMGILPPARANAMRAVYDTMLSNLGDSSAGVGAVVADEDVVNTLRQKPELLKVFQPFLTPEQLNLIIREASND